MHKISVIIPANNEGEYIGKTIEALNKNVIHFELIVVCDSCKDKTREVSKKYTDMVFNVDFQTVSKTRNFGVSKSSGDTLIFLDADTVVSDNYLIEIFKMSETHDIGCAKSLSESKTFFGRYIAWLNSFYGKKNIGGNFFIKKDLFNKLGGFNENMKRGEDTDLGERAKGIGARYVFMENCFIIPSERRYRENGYLKMIIKSMIWGFIYSNFRNYYNKKIGSQFYEEK